jgi:hypothetical protein
MISYASLLPFSLIFLHYKVDKASMLDEAIEYLKTLQLQVQVNSADSSRSLFKTLDELENQIAAWDHSPPLCRSCQWELDCICHQ